MGRPYAMGMPTEANRRSHQTDCEVSEQLTAFRLTLVLSRDVDAYLIDRFLDVDAGLFNH